MDLIVCICTHNRPSYLRDRLQGLRQQTIGAERFDILVVDSASTDGAPAQIADAVRDVGNSRLLRVERPGVSFA